MFGKNRHEFFINPITGFPKQYPTNQISMGPEARVQITAEQQEVSPRYAVKSPAHNLPDSIALGLLVLAGVALSDPLVYRQQIHIQRGGFSSDLQNATWQPLTERHIRRISQAMGYRHRYPRIPVLRVR